MLRAFSADATRMHFLGRCPRLVCCRAFGPEGVSKKDPIIFKNWYNSGLRGGCRDVPERLKG